MRLIWRVICILVVAVYIKEASERAYIIIFLIRAMFKIGVSLNITCLY
jgi:hypothetical protein